MALISAINRGVPQEDPSASQLKRLAIAGGVVTSGAQLFKAIITVAGVVVLSRLLSPDDYGIIGMSAVLTSVLSIVADGGLATATIQKRLITDEETNSIFWYNLALGFAAAIAMLGSAPILSMYFGEPRVQAVGSALAVVFLVRAAGAQHDAILKRSMRFRVTSLIEIGSQGAGLGGAVWCAFGGLGYWSLVVQELIAAVFSTSLVWVACRWRPSFKISKIRLRETLTFGGYLTGYRLGFNVAKNLDALLIGRLLGSEPLGLYTRASMLVTYPVNQIVGPIGTVAVPTLSRLIDEKARHSAALVSICELAVAATLPLAAVIISGSDWIAPLALGRKWQGVSPLVMWLAPIVIYSGLTSALAWALISLGCSKKLFLWSLINAALIVLGIVLSAPYGLTAIAATYGLTGIAVRAPLLLYWTVKHTEVSLGQLGKRTAPHAIAGVVMYVANVTLGIAGPFRSLAVQTTCALGVSLGSYFAVMALLPSGRRFWGRAGNIRNAFITSSTA